MSIIELLNEIGKLAEIINEKNRELENLRKNYDSKLQVINKYIEDLSLSLSPLPSLDTITDENLITRLSTPIECPNCHNRVWENSKNSDFLLIPKHKITTGSELQQEDTSLTTLTQSLPPLSNKPSKNKSKIECSYCKKKGHTRAKCRIRLNTPISTNNHNT